MTLAADHVCFRSSWSHLAAAMSAKHIVGELFECAGVPNARFGDGLEILEEAMRALFVLHLIREDKYGRGEVAGEVGMREETLKKWLVMMVRGPELFRVRALSGPERAVAAVIERRFPHPDERARMEAEWRALLDYNGIADEANIPIALQYQLLQDYYDRAGIRMNDRGTRAFLADRLNRAVTSLDVLPQDLASLVESGSFMTRDLSFWLTAEGFYVPVLKIMGGNPLRLLLVMICREGAADIERASRMAVNIFGKPFAFLNDDAKGYTGRFPMRFSAAVGIRNLNVPPSVGARWEGLIAHVKDAGPRDGSLSIAEAPEMLAMLEQRLGPTAGELPFSAPTDEDRQELRLSRRSVVLAKADSATYAKRHIVGLGGALDGQPVQVAVMGDGVVAILETYGVVTDERGWSIRAGPSGGPLLLGTSGPEVDGLDLPSSLEFAAEAARLADELERVLPPELGGPFRRARRPRRKRRPKLPPLGLGGGPAGVGPDGQGDGVTSTGGVGPGTVGGDGGIRVIGPGTIESDGHGGSGTIDTNGGTLGVGPGGIESDGDGENVTIDTSLSGGETSTLESEHQAAAAVDSLRSDEAAPATLMPQVIRMDHPLVEALIRRSGGDPDFYRELQVRGLFVALAPYAKGHPYELALALSLDPTFKHRVKLVLLVHHGELSYYLDESIITDSMTAHSGIRRARAHLSPEVAEMMAVLNQDLLQASSMVENRQRCRELIGEVLPKLDELSNEEGPVAEKLRNVVAQVERADSFLLAGNLTGAEGALIHAAHLMPVRRVA